MAGGDLVEYFSTGSFPAAWGEVFHLHIVELSTFDVYQQKGIMENAPLLEKAEGTLPASGRKFIIEDEME